MKTVTVRKHELKEILHKNRTEHRGVFVAAQAKYLQLLGEALQEQLNRLKENKKVDLNQITKLPIPKNFTKEYDRAIEMLDMEQAELVILDQHDFRRLVQDEWEWSQMWAVSNSGYTSSPKFAPHINDDL